MTQSTDPNDPANVAASAPPGGPPGAPVPADPAKPDILQPTAPSNPNPVASQDGGAFTFEKTGDVGLDLALQFFGKLGIGPESPEFDQATQGNFQYLEAKLGSMGEKALGWEQYVELGKQAYTRADAQAKSDFEKLEKSIHEAVGGAETWAAVKQFATITYKDSDLAEVKSVLNGGGLAAVALAQYLHRQALAANGTTVPGASAVKADGATAPVTAFAPMTREQWRAEYKAGVAKHGIAGFAKTPEYAALTQRYPR